MMASNGSARSGSGGRAVANRGGRASAATRKRGAEANGKGSAGVAEAVASPTSLRGRAESKEQLIDFYRQMLLIRRFEERTGEMYTKAKIGGYCHLNLGEEATIVGLMAALEAATTTSSPTTASTAISSRAASSPARSWPSCSARRPASREGAAARCTCSTPTPTSWAATRSSAGSCRWRPARPTPQVPGRWTTWSSARWATPPPTSAPGTSRSTWPQLWKLPVIFLIVNNGYGMGTTVEKGSAEPELYKKACAFRMHGERVDGSDVLAVRDATRRVRRARPQGEASRPILEAVSFRFRGHSVIDPDRYRDRARSWSRAARKTRSRCSRGQLLEAELIDEAWLKETAAQVEREVQEAIDFADESPEPQIEGSVRIRCTPPRCRTSLGRAEAIDDRPSRRRGRPLSDAGDDLSARRSTTRCGEESWRATRTSC